MESTALKLGKYRHYNGNLYLVTALARHSETLEEMVVYQGLYESVEFGRNPVWTRPLKSFLEPVEVDGRIVPRFQFLE